MYSWCAQKSAEKYNAKTTMTTQRTLRQIPSRISAGIGKTNVPCYTAGSIWFSFLNWKTLKCNVNQMCLGPPSTISTLKADTKL